MLAPDRLAREIVGPRGHIEVRQAISTASVGRWKKEMGAQDLKLAHRVAGSTLVELGYQVQSVGSESIGDWMILAGLKARYLIVDLTRRLLRSLGLITPNRAKRRSLLSRNRV
jgi:hypothetical protein